MVPLDSIRPRCAKKGRANRDLERRRMIRSRSMQPGAVVWTCAGASLGIALGVTAGQVGFVSILGAVLFFATLRSSLAGFGAILSAMVFGVRADVFGYWMFPVHLVALVVFAALLWRIAMDSSRSREILATTGVLGSLVLLNRLAEAGCAGTASYVAFGSQLGFLALLPRFFYSVWKETSRAYAWCSCMFFLFLAAAAVATGLAAHSWSFLRYVEMWTMAALVAVCPAADRVRSMLWLLVMLAAGAGTLGVAQHFGLVAAGPFPVGAFTRASATFGQPNPFGGFMAMAVAAAFGLSLGERETEVRIARLCLFLSSLGLCASLSRAAIVSCSVALLLLSVLGKRLGLGVGRLAIGLTLVAAGSIPYWWNGTLGARWDAPPPASPASEAGVADDDADTGGMRQRWIGLRTAGRIIAHHPWFGVGPRKYSEAIARYAPAKLDDTYYDNHIHNLYLQIWIDYGVFVLAAFLAGLCVFVVQSMASIERAPTLILPAIGIIAAASFHNLFDVLFVHGLQLLVGFALAVPSLVRRPGSVWAGDERRNS